MKLLTTTIALLFFTSLILTSCGKHELGPHKKDHKCSHHHHHDNDDDSTASTK